jgi:hypothetical protein
MGVSDKNNGPTSYWTLIIILSSVAIVGGVLQKLSLVRAITKVAGNTAVDGFSAESCF